jgi:aspartyl-tRNA synthetase
MNIRTHTCGELKLLDCEKSVYLNGWVNTVRLHGQVIFVDLRDRYGKTQVVFNSEDFNGDFEQVKKLSMEDVLSVAGEVREREKRSINLDMSHWRNRSLCFQNGNIKPCRTACHL